MTDKLYKDNSKLNKATTNSVSSSLLGRIKHMNETSKHNLLIDVSGSMEESVHEEGKSRFETTTKRAILEDLLKKIPEDVTKFAFSQNVVEFKGELPFEGGGTRMGYAFEEVKAKGKKEIVLITDGVPDSEEHALQASAGLKIDIIYIGPQPQPTFLSKLANRTGGSFTNINLVKAGATKELENKVQLFLNA